MMRLRVRYMRPHDATPTVTATLTAMSQIFVRIVTWSPNLPRNERTGPPPAPPRPSCSTWTARWSTASARTSSRWCWRAALRRRADRRRARLRHRPLLERDLQDARTQPRARRCRCASSSPRRSTRSAALLAETGHRALPGAVARCGGWRADRQAGGGLGRQRQRGPATRSTGIGVRDALPRSSWPPRTTRTASRRPSPIAQAHRAPGRRSAVAPSCSRTPRPGSCRRARPGARVIAVRAGNFAGYDLSAADVVVDTLDEVGRRALRAPGRLTRRVRAGPAGRKLDTRGKIVRCSITFHPTSRSTRSARATACRTRRAWSRPTTRSRSSTRCRETGLRAIEITSFVNPKWIPQLADGAEVSRRIARKPGRRLLGAGARTGRGWTRRSRPA